ncbi:MAG: hypothetical protein JSR82_10530 [Verrucomicrobia bacterium]|nr:hypothetical protein [Verrucomicrobiota bacterium]
MRASLAGGTPGRLLVAATLTEAVEQAAQQGAPALLVLDYYLEGRDARSVLPEALQYDEFGQAQVLLIYPPTVEQTAQELGHAFGDRVELLAKPFTTLGFFVKVRPFLVEAGVDEAATQSAEVARPAVAGELGDSISEGPSFDPVDDPAPAPVVKVQPPAPLDPAPPALEEPAPAPSLPPVSPLPEQPMSSPTRFEIIASVPEVTDLFQWRNFGEIVHASSGSMQGVSDSLAFALQLAVRVGADCNLGDVLELQLAGPGAQAGLFNLEGKAHDPGLATFGFLAKPSVPVDDLIRRIRLDCE